MIEAAQCSEFFVLLQQNVVILAAMRFSPKMPAIYIRRVKNSSPKWYTGPKTVSEDKHRKFYSLSDDPESRQFPRAYSFLFEKDLVFGGRQLSHLSSSKTSNETKNVDDVLDFPQLLEVLPKDVRGEDDRKIMSFPLLNPWRIGPTKNVMKETEEAAQGKRSKVLDKLFPVSNFPSVTRVLQATMDDSAKSALARWKEKMIQDMGEVPFIQHQRKIFYRGSLLHRNIALKLKSPTVELQIPDEINGFWNSLSHVFPEVSEVKFMENRVSHPFLCYSGVADCVAEMDGNLVLIDWKTSSRPKPELSNLYDEPIQAVSYAGAVNFDHALSQFHLEKVVIIIAYEDGSPADMHKLSHSHCRDYWKLWLMRLKKYWETLEDKKSRSK